MTLEIEKAPEETPTKVKNCYDAVVIELNSNWNLLLPKYHFKDSQEELPLARKCASLIRFLSWKEPDSIRAIIADWEEKAKHMFSAWIPKSSQEHGTIPRVAKDKSWLRRHAISQSNHLQPHQRYELLEELRKRLDDERSLHMNSEHYRRSILGAASSKSSDTVVPLASRRSLQAAMMTTTETNAPLTPTKKRKSTSPVAESNIKAKKSKSPPKPPIQAKLPDMYKTKKRTSAFTTKLIEDVDDIPAEAEDAQTDVLSRTGSTVALSEQLMTEKSFASTVSADPASIFSNDSRALSSQSTSFETATSKLDSEQFDVTQETSKLLLDSFDAHEQMDNHPLLSELSSHGPFKYTNYAIPKMSLRNRYELERVTRQPQATTILAREVDADTANYKDLFSSLKSMSVKHTIELSNSPSRAAWKSACEDYSDVERRNSVILSGKLTWRPSLTAGILDFRLSPFELERSCRLHRRFGADRFMVVHFPSLSQQVPEYLRTKKYSNLIGLIAHWLATATHHIAGRQWRTFFVEPEKKKAKSDEIPKGFKVHLFAIDGDDFADVRETIIAPQAQQSHQRTRMSINSLLKWHINILANHSSADCKIFQRFSLGLSKTLSTVVLDSNEFLYLRDAPGKTVMNDGCALMSRTLAVEITSALGLDKVPSVFQGRIGGAKGLWMVHRDDKPVGCNADQGSSSDRWIEVSDSQLKIKPHPRDAPHADEEQRTFEVLAYSKPARSAYLNMQLMNILHDRGVVKEVIAELLRLDTDQHFDELCEAMQSEVGLRLWMQAVQKVSRTPDGIKMKGALPDSNEEEIVALLESGFMPGQCSQMTEYVRQWLREYLKRYVDKMSIEIPLSAFVYCIADPYGILAPDEVHLGFTENWRHGVFDDNLLHDTEVLVARLPALLPSDVQRRRAVWKSELRHFKDVIVFSTQGDVPLAHMLSGGDYDGDIPWVCWDQRLVTAFDNVDLPKSLPSVQDCGLTDITRKLHSVIQSETPSDREVDQFLSFCFAFNLQPSFLGICTFEHERLTYSEKTLSSAGTIKLATLAGYLVDAPKQGYKMAEKSWSKLRSETSGFRSLPEPMYKLDSVRNPSFDHIIDYLKFGVATVQMNKILSEFSKKWPKEGHADQDLLAPYKKVAQRAKDEAAVGKIALRSVLDKLKNDMKDIYTVWLLGSKGQNDSISTQFNQTVETVCRQLRETEPLNVDHPLVARWRGKSDGPVSQWSLVRASCLYNTYKFGRLPWYAAGDQLCKIKAEACGASKMIVDKIHLAYRVDSKLAKQIIARARDVDDEYGWKDGDSQLMVDLIADDGL